MHEDLNFATVMKINSKMVQL